MAQALDRSCRNAIIQYGAFWRRRIRKLFPEVSPELLDPLRRTRIIYDAGRMGIVGSARSDCRARSTGRSADHCLLSIQPKVWDRGPAVGPRVRATRSTAWKMLCLRCRADGDPVRDQVLGIVAHDLLNALGAIMAAAAFPAGC